MSSGADHSNLQSQQKSADMIAEIDASHEKLQVSIDIVNIANVNIRLF